MLITFIRFRSRRLHGRRGLKCKSFALRLYVFGRRLHGRRGLKWLKPTTVCVPLASPPSRAAWIEMRSNYIALMQRMSRRLHGRRGLKSSVLLTAVSADRRRLHGRRGLKYGRRLRCLGFGRRRLHGRRGLKYRRFRQLECPQSSPPSRAAWIEMR